MEEKVELVPLGESIKSGNNTYETIIGTKLNVINFMYNLDETIPKQKRIKYSIKPSIF